MLIIVQRQKKTNDGILGKLDLPTTPLSCYTIENLEHAIPAGSYKVVIDFSPRLQIMTPHIIVPSRDIPARGDAGIRIHPANFPYQLEGCIAVGDKLENDAVDDSKKTFQELMYYIDGQDLTIKVLDIV